jgi:GT2 family glycosyltransferase
MRTLKEPFMQSTIRKAEGAKKEDKVSKVTISIVIPNLNGINYLETCLNSIKEQSFQEYEVIIVDDGSIDSSVAYIESHYPWVRVIEHDDIRGFCESVNDGIKAAEGEYIVLLNNDTMVDKRWLEKLMKAAKKNPTTGFYSSKMFFYGRGKEKLINAAGDEMSVDGNIRNIGFYQKDSEEYSQSKKVFGACAGAAMYRRSMLDEIGYFDEDFFIFYDDADISFRAQLLGYECVYVPEAVVYHVHSGTIGLLSEQRAFLTSVNNLNVLIKNMPLKLFLRYFYNIYRTQVSQIYEFSGNPGGVKPLLKGKLRALKLLARMLRKRRWIQRNKAVSDEHIEDLLLEGTRDLSIKGKKRRKEIKEGDSSFNKEDVISDSEDNRFLFDRFFEALEEVKKDVKRILILRSSRFWIINQILSILRDKYPDSEISILAQPSVRSDLEGSKGFQKFFWMKRSGKFGVFNTGFKTLKTLRKEEYDLVVVPLSAKGLSQRQLMSSQINLHGVIMGIKPKTAVFVDSEGTTIIQKSNARKYFLDYFLPAKLIGFFLIKAMMFPYMLFILLMITGCDSWSLLKSRLWKGFFEKVHS